MSGGTGRRRIVIAGATLLGLLAAVGLASRAHSPGGSGHGRGLDSDILLEYALLLIAATAIVVVPVAIYAFVAGRREEAVSLPSRRNWMLAVFLTMSALAVVSIALLASGYFKHHNPRARGTTVNPLLSLVNQGKRAPGAVRFDWAPVIVVSTLTAAGLAALVIAFVRRREPTRTRRRPAETLALALDESLDDLRSERDPRRAVIAAYARMERALARSGLAREPFEAPREYLHRVLPGVGAGAASIERLTELFERAKFSVHTIDAAMKEEAIVAFESLRDDLRSAS